MPQQLTQDSRLIAISPLLGKDKLLLTAFEGAEYISDLFQFHLEVLSEDLNIAPDKVIGKTVTVTIQNEHKRKFNGYVSRFTFGEIKADNLREYRLTIVPWMWFLSKTNNHRIFQNKDSKTIISDVFQASGFNDFDMSRVTGGTTMREYCVQYDESDLNFVSRLMEEEGIAYYFKHEDGKHTLIMTDKANGYEACTEDKVGYSKGNKPGTQITDWEHAYEFITGKWSHTDYNFETPTKNLQASRNTTVKVPLIDKFEHYSYPGLYAEKPRGESLIEYRLEAEESGHDTVVGGSDCSSFFAGGTFKLHEHDTAGEKQTYIITSIHHQASDSSYFSGDEGQSTYGNHFVCMPDSYHFRPTQRHVQPIIRGPQSAVVVGPSGEEIYIDQYGRIKVQFFWDREGKLDENSTCFIRVMQPWAGNQWGTSFIPRIGMEVIVNFLDGNPDRPLVTGSVYNADNMPPYSAKTQSGIKTRSTQDGTSANFNEIRFEDKKGQEQVYMHAERNMDTMVENDETLTVDNDRTKLIKHDENSTIENDRNKKVNKNQTETIGENKTIDVGKDHNETIGKDMTLSVGQNLKETIDKNYDSDTGKNLTFTAGDQIVLKTGSASITMKKNGDITIKGKNITVQGSGKVNVKASSTVTLKGSKVVTN